MSPAGTPDAYVIAHVQEALATDPRVSELGIDMTIAGGRIVLTGSVASEDLRSAAERVATDNADGLDVVNDLDVVDVEATPAPPERLP